MKQSQIQSEAGSVPLTLALLSALALAAGLIFQVAYVAASWMSLRHEASQIAIQVAKYQLFGESGCGVATGSHLHDCQVLGNEVEVVLTKAIQTPIGLQQISARAAVGFRFPEP